MTGTEPICRENDAGVGARNSNSIKTVIAKCILRGAIEPIHLIVNLVTHRHILLSINYLLNGTIYFAMLQSTLHSFRIFQEILSFTFQQKYEQIKTTGSFLKS